MSLILINIIYLLIILKISKRSGGISKDENIITVRLAPTSCAIKAITLDATQ